MHTVRAIFVPRSQRTIIPRHCSSTTSGTRPRRLPTIISSRPLASRSTICNLRPSGLKCRRNGDRRRTSGRLHRRISLARAVADRAPIEAAMAKRMSVWSLLAFSSPAIPATLLIAPVFGVLPSYYTLHTHVTLAEVGAAFLLARVVDALIDPLIGILSDRTRSVWGARLPWMILGAVLSLPSAYFFFLPPKDAGGIYFFVTSFLTMVAWTLLTIPHGAWAAELTDDYDELSRIFAFRNVLASVGAFGFFLLPPILAPFTHTTEINNSTMLGLVAALFVLMPATWAWAAAKPPSRGALIERVAAPPASLMSVLQSVAHNRPFLCYVAITTFAGVAVGMR